MAYGYRRKTKRTTRRKPMFNRGLVSLGKAYKRGNLEFPVSRAQKATKSFKQGVKTAFKRVAKKRKYTRRY